MFIWYYTFNSFKKPISIQLWCKKNFETANIIFNKSNTNVSWCSLISFYNLMMFLFFIAILDYLLIPNRFFFMLNKTIWTMFLFFSWFLSMVPLLKLFTFGLNIYNFIPIVLNYYSYILIFGLYKCFGMYWGVCIV
jgi:hypothetical protein